MRRSIQHRITDAVMHSLFLSISLCTIAFANPVLDHVAAGDVSISQTATTTNVQQTSQQAIVDWKSFNINSNETTHFQQPTNGIILNRIDPSQGASQILGRLTATGQVVLVNQAGIYFGSGAHVDVGGLIASTSDISDANFMKGNYVFDQASQYGGSIVNAGSIKVADYGLAALIGNNVVNNGKIAAHLGSVVLASGSAFTVSFDNNQLINFAVTKAADQNGGIVNKGVLIADGGMILVTAEAAKSVLDNVIDMEGVAQANSVSQKDGTIILSGGDEGTVTVSGTLMAAGQSAGSQGGTIKVLGNAIHMTSSSVVNVNGNAGGGEILVGGNEHGLGPEPNAMQTVVDSGAKFSANALVSGNGGTVIVWSNNDTLFHGSISAQGAAGGNGGFVETSGQYLDVSGAEVNLLAVNGKTGTWLLDPSDLTISSSPTSNVDISGTTYTGDQPDSADVSNLNITDLLNALATADVTVQTTTTGTGGNGDIAVNTEINWNQATTLTLSAYRNIYLNADIIAPNGGLILSAISLGQTLTAGSIGSNPVLGGAVNSVTANVNVKNFTLAQGNWFQTSTTPTFLVSNDFQITTGAQFTRVNNTSDPYVITDIFGLEGAATGPLSTDYVLGNNIDGTVTQYWNSGAGFNSFGDYTGTFDGQNFAISNYYSINQGLFVQNDGTIQNLTLTSPTIVLGAGSVNSGEVGGLVGFNRAIMDNDHITGLTITINGGSPGDVGGLVARDGDYNVSSGMLYLGTITNSSVTGTITNYGYVSGDLALFSANLVSDVTIQNDYAIGTINNTSSGKYTSIGLLVGNNSDYFGTSVSDSYAMGTINNTESGGNEYIGGLIGFTYASISNSFAIVNIVNNDLTGGELIGGIVGFAYGGTINNTYAQGSISTNGTGYVDVGGIAGHAYASINNSYAAVLITTQSNPNATVGGIAGIGSSLSNDVFDASYGGAAVQADTSTNQGCFACSTPGYLDMSSEATYASTLGWDFSGTWGIIDGSSYPYLLSFYSATPRAVSGTVTGNNASDQVQLAVGSTNLVNSGTNGNITQGLADIGANGFYYFLEANNVIPDSSTITATTTSTNLSGSITAPTGGASITGFNLPAIEFTFSGTVPVGTLVGSIVDLLYDGTILGSGTTDSSDDFTISINEAALQSEGQYLLYLSGANTYSNYFTSEPATVGNISGINLLSNTLSVAAGDTTTISNTSLATTLGLVSTSDILFSAALNSGAGYDLTLGNTSHPNVDFVTSSQTNYQLDGSISNPNGSSNITFNGPTALSNSVVVSGTSVTMNDVNGNGNNLTISNTDNNSRILGDFSGAGSSLIHEGSGVLIIDNTNTYTGPTDIDAGTLEIDTGASSMGTSNFVVNSGATLNLNDVSITNPIQLNGGSLSSTNNSSVNNVSLTADSTITAVNNGDSLTVNGSIEGSSGLTLSGLGNVTLGVVGDVTALASFVVNVATTLTGNITTVGAQTYNSPITLTQATLFTSNAGNISINDGVLGDQNLTLAGSTGPQQFYLSGSLDSNNLTVQGGTGSNTLTLNTSDPNVTYTLTSPGAGTIQGVTELTGIFSYTNIQNFAGFDNPTGTTTATTPTSSASSSDVEAAATVKTTIVNNIASTSPTNSNSNSNTVTSANMLSIPASVIVSLYTTQNVNQIIQDQASDTASEASSQQVYPNCS